LYASLRQVVQVIEIAALDELAKDFRPDCCIAATRCVLRVLKHFGYRGDARSVECYVFNPAYVAAVLRGDSPPLTGRRSAAFIEWANRTGAHSVGIGCPDEIEHERQVFEGHLVVTVKNFLIDASIKQGDRPQHAIVLPEVLVVDKFRGFPVDLSCANGAELRYVEKPERIGFHYSPDWKDKRRTFRAAKRIIDYIEGKKLLRSVTG